MRKINSRRQPTIATAVPKIDRSEPTGREPDTDDYLHDIAGDVDEIKRLMIELVDSINNLTDAITGNHR
jgi:hypothetical protein